MIWDTATGQALQRFRSDYPPFRPDFLPMMYGKEITFPEVRAERMWFSADQTPLLCIEEPVQLVKLLRVWDLQAGKAAREKLRAFFLT